MYSNNPWRNPFAPTANQTPLPREKTIREELEEQFRLEEERQRQQSLIPQPDYSHLSLREELEARFRDLENQQNNQNITPIQPVANNSQISSPLPQGFNSYSAIPNQPMTPWHSGYQNYATSPVGPLSQSVTQTQVDYSKYGDGFSRQMIDEMLNDNRFQKAMRDYVIPNEGGYINHPDDKGGETNFGISKKYYPNEDIKNLTRERANAILYRDFWKWNGIHKLPDEIVGIVFDDGVNSSPLQAIKNTHRALGIVPGNIIGEQTLNTLKTITPEEFLTNYREEVKSLRQKIVERDSSQAVFSNGWNNRINRYHSSK